MSKIQFIRIMKFNSKVVSRGGLCMSDSDEYVFGRQGYQSKRILAQAPLSSFDQESRSGAAGRGGLGYGMTYSYETASCKETALFCARAAADMTCCQCTAIK